MINQELTIEELKNIKITFENKMYVVALIDKTGFEIIRGYGDTPADALNDLHSNLI